MNQQVRYSRKREAILRLLRTTKSHPTAEQIYRELKSEYPDLSLGTVYRNLRFFVDHGEVQSVAVVNGQERFDGNIESHPHCVCDRCGAVIDVSPREIPSLEVMLDTETGFQVEGYELIFHGLCSKCRKAVENKNVSKKFNVMEEL